MTHTATFPLQPSRLQETRALLAIALPLVAAYLAEYLMFLTTKAVVGSLGVAELAAAGLAGELAFDILVVVMGILSIIGVLAAQAEGAGDKARTGLAVRQGFVVAVALAIPSTLMVWHLDLVMVWTSQDAEVIRLARPFLWWLAPAVLPILLFSVVRNFVAALSNTRPVMVITIVAVAVNWTLTEGLVHGRFGLPEMGIAGAGLAMSIVSWAMFLALIGYAYLTPTLRGYGVFSGRLRLDARLCREILSLGLPVGGLVAIEAGLFVAVGLVSGFFGAETLASHTMVMSWIAIPFVIALGLAEGTMVRVAHGVGRGSLASARASGVLGAQIGVCILGVLILVPVTQSGAIIQLFLTRDDPRFDEVQTLAGRMLMIAAIFQVFDGLQAIASRALRGVKDTVAPLWIAAFGYWVLGIGGGSVLAFGLDLRGEGLWWGLALGLIITSLLLCRRFLTLTRPG
ncbi:MATE family efflux transporter [Rhodobacteraceae bacterium NNCM2]|nr:MATE family efflux transporter [Coraliihabitans acroporae]